MTLADRINAFNRELSLDEELLPPGIRVMNPFSLNPEVLEISSRFYHTYYSDNNPRRMIVGINPGRLGAGQTGIPFSDSKRLQDACGIPISSVQSHEPSSVFMYEMIASYGGPEAFYNEFYINSVCPLGFLEQNTRGNWVNCNYYDYPELFEAVKDFCVKSLRSQIDLGMQTSVCYVLGKKNATFLQLLNQEYRLFDRLIPLHHPRYIIQYKSRQMDAYVKAYLEAFQA